MLAAAVLVALAGATFQPVTAATTAQPPQVYVRDASAQAQTGANPHDWGLRPPGDNDSDAAPLLNAKGDSIKAGLGVWRTATGTATIEPGAQGGSRVKASFRGLLPNARYSLFVRQLAGRTGAVFTPLDLVGATNNFSADGAGLGDQAYFAIFGSGQRASNTLAARKGSIAVFVTAPTQLATERSLMTQLLAKV